MKTLITIGIRRDRQCATWSTLIANAGGRSPQFAVEDFGRSWWIALDDGVASLRTSDDRSFTTDDADLCWYVRAPGRSDRDLESSLSLLHDSLAEQAWPNGNYFFSHRGGGRLESSKLLQYEARASARFPSTSVTNVGGRAGGLRSSDRVVKSISAIRSIAVPADDSRLVLDAQFPAPVQLQERCQGWSTKVHVYHRRDGRPVLFGAYARSAEVDYRYARAVDITGGPAEPEWSEVAQIAYARTECRFFDFDLISTEAGYVLLEVNLAPVPTYYESVLFGERFPFSSAVLKDWTSA